MHELEFVMKSSVKAEQQKPNVGGVRSVKGPLLAKTITTKNSITVTDKLTGE